jgi:hypothetical protein
MKGLILLALLYFSLAAEFSVQIVDPGDGRYPPIGSML